MRYTKTTWSTLVLALALAVSAPLWSQTMSPGAPEQAGEVEPSNDVVRAVQEALKEKGHYNGQIDGNWGAETQAALKAFQQSSGLEATGQLDEETKEKLGMSSSG